MRSAILLKMGDTWATFATQLSGQHVAQKKSIALGKLIRNLTQYQSVPSERYSIDLTRENSIALRKNYRQTAAFLKTLRGRALRAVKRVHIDAL